MNRIADVLKEMGIKQIWLAEQIGKSYNMVNSYVCNRRQPSIETLFDIAEKLNIKPHVLIKGGEVVNKNELLINVNQQSEQVCDHCKGSGLDSYPNHSTTYPVCPKCQI